MNRNSCRTIHELKSQIIEAATCRNLTEAAKRLLSLESDLGMALGQVLFPCRDMISFISEENSEGILFIWILYISLHLIEFL